MRTNDSVTKPIRIKRIRGKNASPRTKATNKT